MGGLQVLSGALNQNHAFSARLIESATALHEKYPGIFNAIRKNVSLPQLVVNEEALAELNAALDRPRALGERPRPAEMFRLTPDDFGHMGEGR